MQITLPAVLNAETLSELLVPLEQAVSPILLTGAADCFEIETYTWDVLPLKEGELLDSLEAEYRYVLAELAKAGTKAASSS